MAPGYLSLQEAAQNLGMDADELKQMAQKKEIRSFQDRGTLRFRVQDIQELGRRRGTVSSEPDLVLGESGPVIAKNPSKLGPKTPTQPPAKSQLSPKNPNKLTTKSQLGAKSQPGPKSAPPARQEPAPQGEDVMDFSLEIEGSKASHGQPKSAAKPPSGPRTPPKQHAPVGDDVFDFSLEIDEGIDIGKEILGDPSAGSKKSGSKSPGAGRKSALRSPPPKPGSDSDVKLVGEVASAGSDSDLKVVAPASSVKNPDAGKTPKVVKKSESGSPRPQRSSAVTAPQPDSGSKKHPSRVGVAQPADSGVRLVPMDSDSDVKIVGAGSDEIPLGASPPQSPTDSDIRLDKYGQPAPASESGEMNLTEEINLDEEVKKQEAALRQPPAKLKPKSKLKFPTTSPFELSESDVKHSSPDSSDFDLRTPGSSDLDSSDGSGSVLLQPEDSDDFSLELPPDDSATGGEPKGLSAPSSGISLNNPVDAGISLEEGSTEASDVDFDLSLEVEATPRPVQAASSPADSDSEFELSLDADDSSVQAPSPADSDSEFELTLDDSGGLTPSDSQNAAAAGLQGDSAEKDIFETDFEVPALEDESGSQVAVLDTDLDSSDFDIALDDSAVEDESASQVVALDEEADEAATTRATDEEEVAVAEEGFGGLSEGEEEVVEVEEDLDDAKTVVKEKLIQPAPWGALPVVFMLPCVIVMVLVGLMGFELIQSSTGYHAPGFLTKAISEMFSLKMK